MLTNFNNSVSDSASSPYDTMVEIFRADSDEISAKLSETAKIRYHTDGDILPNIIAAGFRFNPAKSNATTIALRERRRRLLSDRRLAGDNATAEVITARQR